VDGSAQNLLRIVAVSSVMLVEFKTKFERDPKCISILMFSQACPHDNAYPSPGVLEAEGGGDVRCCAHYSRLIASPRNLLCSYFELEQCVVVSNNNMGVFCVIVSVPASCNA
jgi:hypothetical protein